MNCYYCDYLKKTENNNESFHSCNFICEYSHYVFPENVEDLNMEYPCSMPEYAAGNIPGTI